MVKHKLIEVLEIFYYKYSIFRTKMRCCFLFLLGFRMGKSTIIGRSNKFPLLNLKNLKIMDDVQIGEYGKFFLPVNNRECEIVICEGVHIGDRFTISCNNKILIGEHCLVSYNVSLLDY